MLNLELLLTHYNPSLSIVIAADAPGYGMWAVIYHIFPNGSEKVITHISRVPTPTEKNCGKIEKKASTIIYAVKNSMTPNKPEAFVISIWLKKMSPSLFSNPSSTVRTHINEYDYNIRYQKTENFGQFDRLSRLIDNRHTSYDSSTQAILEPFPTTLSQMERENAEVRINSASCIMRKIPRRGINVSKCGNGLRSDAVEENSVGEENLESEERFCR
ncbi:unnamed protein product [Hymenolepis diminuta]|uniref:RT_RNaseH_2 domain-containing protein n=1 Tax=Hymenolepis diminuta TaxID=6216 RepID=A0A0R3SMA1_HYMDI|nr:unnamed protein product [Hymenolepis diminuta]